MNPSHWQVMYLAERICKLRGGKWMLSRSHIAHWIGLAFAAIERAKHA